MGSSKIKEISVNVKLIHYRSSIWNIIWPLKIMLNNNDTKNTHDYLVVRRYSWKMYQKMLKKWLCCFISLEMGLCLSFYSLF